jgi:hypothetical protein
MRNGVMSGLLDIIASAPAVDTGLSETCMRGGLWEHQIILGRARAGLVGMADRVVRMARAGTGETERSMA